MKHELIYSYTEDRTLSIVEETTGAAQILDFTKDVDQIEIQYPQSDPASVPVLELAPKDGAPSDLSIKIRGNEVAVIKDAFGKIEVGDIFLRAV